MNAIKQIMDLTSPKTIKELLARHNTKPSKTMGQNFLINKSALNNIIEAADVQPSDVVLEIGPGIGTLTQALAQKAKKVICIEKDRAMLPILQETLHAFKNIEITQGDVLKSAIALPKNYKLVANLPYYITSPIIRMFLESKNPPEYIVLMVQKEVAQRICAKPPNMSILAVSVQFYAKAQIISHVLRGCFWPMPNVDSAIIKIIPFGTKSEVPPEAFFQIVKAGFLHPRKQLLNNFSQALKKDRQEITDWLSKNNIKPTQRAETLTIQNWIALTKSL